MARTKRLYPKHLPTVGVVLLSACLFLLIHYWPIDHDRGPSRVARLEPRDISSDGGMTENFTYNALDRRDDYSCGPGKPCKNGACCGKSGYCGYGPASCGSGCVSNCQATAECGQYASTAGKTCPLNTCCSQYGFCGTTQEFCDEAQKCQSNCVLHPAPPGGGGGGNVLKKVIGYYEGWNSASSCHPMKPSDLPLDALTHVNFAFAYIDPGSLQITTMDQRTPVDLFKEVTAVKDSKPDLKVFVSVGGWSFSDNGTATQPLYGEIAADAGKRATFGSNVVNFLNQYGFDGIDIDWEYPGAPDRGGHPDDTANYVSLLQSLRTSFNASPRPLEITFTVPSSYWYLRWFDLPNMIKYADWINLMSYDLHGVWDASNPIGSIVQGHTNLTEIRLAAELLWRVKIPPAKVSLGFGFYGRSFQLADPTCQKPGCPFTGGAKPGPCTATSGILSYYEIMDIVKGSNPTTSKSRTKRAGVQPVHDVESAVNYVTYDNDQWVSYDDAVTMKQKVDWANSAGLGGSLIWASDLDDQQFSAHSGLIGRQVSKTSVLGNQMVDTQNWQDQNGQNCYRMPDCVDPNIVKCKSGFSKAGEDAGGCGKGHSKPICCPSTSNLGSCIWRGSGGDCNGQCHPGEINLFGSSWGGWPTESNQRKCSRGRKLFCCESAQWTDLTAGCSWTSCGKDCAPGTDEVGKAKSDCWQSKFKKYCCKSPSPFQKCHWIPNLWDTDCTENKCAADEIEVALDTSGDARADQGCNWGRKRALCCQAPVEATCDASLCDVFSGYCPAEQAVECPDDSEADTPDYVVGPGDDGNPDLEKRYGYSYNTTLEPRGKRQRKTLQSSRGNFDYILAAWPGRARLMQTRNGQQVLQNLYTLANNNCRDTNVRGMPLPNRTPRTGHTEHPRDHGSWFRAFWATCATGKLPGGGQTTVPPLSLQFLQNDLLAASLPAGLGGVGNGPNAADPRSPNDRLAESFGSCRNRNNFLLADEQLNSIKGRIFGQDPPVAADRFTALVNNAIAQQAGEEQFLQYIRMAIAVFVYLNEPQVAQRLNNVRQEYRAQANLIESNLPSAANLRIMVDEFDQDYDHVIVNFARTWAADRIVEVQAAYTTHGQTGTAHGQAVLRALNELFDALTGIRMP